MYVIFGTEIVDSEELKDIITSNSDFIVEKDMSKATKREDVVAYQLSIPVNILNKELKHDYDLNEMSEDSFKISVTDGVNTVYVEVIVNINEPPVASNQTFNAPQGDVYENEITAIDLDDDKLSFAVTKQGNLGNVKIDSETGKFVYTPNSKSYVAARDQFTVSISDGNRLAGRYRRFR